MALFPKIQSPCPYQANLAAIMDGDMCRMCKREVVDLTAMDDVGRVAFFGDCATEVCVSYRVPIRSALGAAALAAAAVAALPAAAQDSPAPTVDVTVAAAAVDEAPVDEGDEIVIIAGGIKDVRNVEFVEEDPTQTSPTCQSSTKPRRPRRPRAIERGAYHGQFHEDRTGRGGNDGGFRRASRGGAASCVR